MRKRLQVLVERGLEALGRGPKGRFFLLLGKVLWRHHVERAASSMAFALFFACIPLLALAGWSLSQLLHSSAQATESISSTFGLAPEQVRHVVSQHAGRFASGTVAPVVIFGALWLASGAFHTLLSIFESQLGARHRSWWRKRLLSLACVLLLLLAVASATSLTVALAGGPMALFGFAPLQARSRLLATGVGLLVALATVTLLVAGLFGVGLERRVSRRRIWPGAFTTVAIGSVASFVFARFVENIARYAAYYGSLAAVAVVLAWLWICSAALLVGAEVNAQLEGPSRQ